MNFLEINVSNVKDRGEYFEDGVLFTSLKAEHIQGSHQGSIILSVISPRNLTVPSLKQESE